MTETSVREWVIHSYSGYKGLVLQDCEIEEAGPGEVRLRIEAFALNWGDADLMLDNYSFSFPKFPARIGMEACGIIDQIGEGVTGLRSGSVIAHSRIFTLIAARVQNPFLLNRAISSKRLRA